MTTKPLLFLFVTLSFSACTQPETASETISKEAVASDMDKKIVSASTTDGSGESALSIDNASTNATPNEEASNDNDSDNALDSTLNNSLNSARDSASPIAQYDPQKVLRPNISQQFVGISPTEIRLAYALPELPYDTDDLPSEVQLINEATWSKDAVMDEALTIRIQALLNYHHHKVGVVDGKYGKNVTKAIAVFQEKHNLEVTGEMNNETWRKLTENEALNNVPVLVNYTLRQSDVDLPYHSRGQQYRSVTESVAERFHMSQGLLTRLNPKTALRAGNSIIVYNPYQPNTVPVHRVVANKSKNLLLAYDKDDNLVASYPTTMGSNYKPSPNGAYEVLNRVIDPTYNKDFSNKNSVLPPGPNNPVGRVWIGISKPSYGIHGSPNPEKISQQKSSGCVRLTNWDALGLFGTIQKGAKVEFE